MRVLILAIGIGTISVAAYCQQQPTKQAEKAVDERASADDTPKVTKEKTMSFWMAKKLEFCSERPAIAVSAPTDFRLIVFPFDRLIAWSEAPPTPPPLIA